MAEELAIACAQIVEARLAVTVADEAIARTLTMAGKTKDTLTALSRQGREFLLPEPPLLLTVEHLRECLLVDAAQAVLRKYEMVTGIDTAVAFHHGSATAGGR